MVSGSGPLNIILAIRIAIIFHETILPALFVADRPDRFLKPAQIQIPRTLWVPLLEAPPRTRIESSNFESIWSACEFSP